MNATLTKWRNGKWYLWCNVMQMNIAMEAKDETAAYKQAIRSLQHAIERRNVELTKLRGVVEAVMEATEPMREDE